MATALFLFFTSVALADYFLYPLLVKPDTTVFNRGDNGLWMGSQWYLGKANKDSTVRMSQRLKEAQIRYAYFHVRDINKAGLLRYHCDKAAISLLQTLKKNYPQVKAIAWIGAVNAQSGGEVSLASNKVRSRMASETKWLTQVCGFDGVQWDFEICKDGDPQFLALLKETRKALPPGKILSIAAPALWSSRYYAPIARTCDQVAVMCYDTVSIFPRYYVAIVSQETSRVTAAVARVNPACKVILGVPTYKDRTIAHQLHAENLMMALVGVKAGLKDRRAQLSVFAGIAPYADFTTGDSEWSIYRRYWLNAAPTPGSHLVAACAGKLEQTRAPDKQVPRKE